MNTPWGKSDNVRELGQGILCVTTPSHGGIFVPKNLLSKISKEGRAEAKGWSGSDQWYEEDCCWSHVCIAFPELFREEQVKVAKKILTNV